MGSLSDLGSGLRCDDPSRLKRKEYGLMQSDFELNMQASLALQSQGLGVCMNLSMRLQKH